MRLGSALASGRAAWAVAGDKLNYSRKNRSFYIHMLAAIDRDGFKGVSFLKDSITKEAVAMFM